MLTHAFEFYLRTAPGSERDFKMQGTTVDLDDPLSTTHGFRKINIHDVTYVFTLLGISKITKTKNRLEDVKRVREINPRGVEWISPSCVGVGKRSPTPGGTRRPGSAFLES